MQTTVETIDGHHYRITKDDDDNVIDQVCVDPISLPVVASPAALDKTSGFTLDDIGKLLIYIATKR